MGHRTRSAVKQQGECGWANRVKESWWSDDWPRTSEDYQVGHGQECLPPGETGDLCIGNRWVNRSVRVTGRLVPTRVTCESNLRRGTSVRSRSLETMTTFIDLCIHAPETIKHQCLSEFLCSALQADCVCITCSVISSRWSIRHINGCP